MHFNILGVTVQWDNDDAINNMMPKRNFLTANLKKDDGFRTAPTEKLLRHLRYVMFRRTSRHGPVAHPHGDETMIVQVASSFAVENRSIFPFPQSFHIFSSFSPV
jgi:hypothetical protein